MTDVVPLKFALKDKIIQIECLCTSLIYSDIANQDIMSVSSSYPPLKNLSLPDLSNSKNRTIDILVGAEHYYRFIYGNVIRGKVNEPIAVESLFRWVLTLYYDTISTTNNFNAIHALCVNSEICKHSNDDYKTMKKVLNYHNDKKSCMENENNYVENFKKTLKHDRKQTT